MDAKEKAVELYDKYYDAITEHWNAGIVAKQCALIAVDEILNAIDFDRMQIQNLNSEHRYWQKVKEEIENL